MKNSNFSILILAISFVLALWACSKDKDPDTPGTGTPTSDTTPNILLIIADDMGKDAINGYSEGIIKPNTPHLDAIRNSGLIFNNFWVNPTCTPTRSSVITGKYGYRTGVKAVGDVLSSSEVVLQKYINDNTNNKYASAVVGKWHLSGTNATFNPESFGIDYYSGIIRGAVENYFQWQKTENGTNKTETQYTTEAFTDLAINWVKDQSKPWFLWLAYNAPHTPFHVPPSGMHSQGNLPAYATGMNPMPYYMAAIEAMDYQIGRLLDNIPESERANTIIIFMGDNGTVNQVAQSPYTSTTVKGTLYQGGINVPLFVSGTGVSRVGKDDNLINGTDLFATISEIAGLQLNQYHDSQSFKSLLSQSGSIRKYQYAEQSEGTSNAWAIRNVQYKLIVNSNGNKEFYHLTNDPAEQNNLLNGTLTPADETTKAELEAELARIRQ